jgi:hypothetical protein
MSSIMDKHREELRGDRSAAGISNRESPSEEDRGRREHPPVDDTPEPEDAAGRRGGESVSLENEQTSNKAGAHSTAKKASGYRFQ